MATHRVAMPFIGLRLRSLESLLSAQPLLRSPVRTAITSETHSLKTRQDFADQIRFMRTTSTRFPRRDLTLSFQIKPKCCSYSSSRPPYHPPPDPRDAQRPSSDAQRHPHFPPLSPEDFDFYKEPPKPELPKPPVTPLSSTQSHETNPSQTSSTLSASSNSTTTSTTNSSDNPDLPSSIKADSRLTESISSFIDRAQTTLFAASQRINDLTGYSGIETLKTRISTLEDSLEKAQTHLHDTRAKYKASVADRASTQREITALLARQKTWTPLDFERFTTLYRQDYEHEGSVADNATALEEAERESERLNRELSSGILARYHEEQIWSDKIRRMSTWGTWGLMAVNIFLFLVLQFGAEPWRRKRLVKGFEEKVREALAHEREIDRADAKAAAVAASVAAPAAVEIKPEPVIVATSEPEKITPAEEPTVASLHDITTSVTGEPVTLPRILPTSWAECIDEGYWRDLYAELSSDRALVVQMKDLSWIALQGAATGAATMAFSVLFYSTFLKSI